MVGHGSLPNVLDTHGFVHPALPRRRPDLCARIGRAHSRVRDLFGLSSLGAVAAVQELQQRQPKSHRSETAAAKDRLAMVEVRQANLRHPRKHLVFDIELTIMRAPGAQGVEAIMVGIRP